MIVSDKVMPHFGASQAASIMIDGVIHFAHNYVSILASLRGIIIHDCL